MRTLLRDLVEFHVADGHPIDHHLDPVVDDRDEVLLFTGIVRDLQWRAKTAYHVARSGGRPAVFRAALMLEELAETIDAMARGDAEDVADGLVDLVYVTVGTGVTYGLDLAPVWEEVHNANMRKFGPGSWKDDSGKTRKPNDWEGPDIKAALGSCGMTGRLRVSYEPTPLTYEEAWYALRKWGRHVPGNEAPTPKRVKAVLGWHWPRWQEAHRVIQEQEPPEHIAREIDRADAEIREYLAAVKRR